MKNGRRIGKMGERERDLLERCRVLESRLGTLGAYADIVKTLGPFVLLNDQHQFVIIEDAAAELTRLRKIEAAARSIQIAMDGPDSWGKVKKLIDRLRPLLETETDG